MPSSYIALANWSASRISFESIMTLSPDGSVSAAPKLNIIERQLRFASLQWENAMPVGLPFGLRVRAATRASSHVSGGFSPFAVEQVLPPEHREQDVVHRDAVDAALDLDGRFRRGDPAPVLLAELIVDVRHVDQRLVVEPGEDGRVVEDEVVPGARGELGGHPRRDLQVRDMVHAHLDAVLLAPLGGELVEPDVVGRDEVAPRENAQRGPLELRRAPGAPPAWSGARLPPRRPPRPSGSGGGRPKRGPSGRAEDHSSLGPPSKERDYKWPRDATRSS